MTTGPITKTSVDRLQCPEGKDREILWDGGHRESVRGFGVVAYRNGGKVYVVQYRKDGRSHRSRLGEHGRLTPEEARTQAKIVTGLVETGADPVAERKAARGVPTLGKVADDFMRLHVATKRKGRTGDEYGRMLKAHVLPALGSRRVTEIKRADIAKLHTKISARGPYLANRVIALISSIWTWAGRRDLVSFADNPAKGIERNREQGRERYLTGAELARLGDALRDAETIGLLYNEESEKPNSKHGPKEGARRMLDPYAITAIRLLILTGARLREILHAHWQDVDFERGMIFLPDSKTGKKPLYLSAAALEVLASIPKVKGNPHIIAGDKAGAPRADLNKPWRAVRKAAGLEDVRCHDLRHSFASIGAGASLGLPIIGKLLGHKQAATTQRYAHLDSDPLRRAVDTIGATISAAMAPSPGAEIVPFKRGA